MDTTVPGEGASRGALSWQAVVSLLLMSVPLAEAPGMARYATSVAGIAGGSLGGYGVAVIAQAVVLAVWLGFFALSERLHRRWLPLLAPVVAYALVGSLLFVVMYGAR